MTSVAGKHTFLRSALQLLHACSTRVLLFPTRIDAAVDEVPVGTVEPLLRLGAVLMLGFAP
jgi:hypothetical protein